MRFYETNTKDDPGFELSPDEVAARFWQSDIGEAWAADPENAGRLDRAASVWIAEKLGGCDPDTLDEALQAIFDARPKR